MKSCKFLITFSLASMSAFATTMTFQAPTDMVTNGLDHHLVYTWGITGVNLSGQTITGASLTFSNLANWDSNPNSLFIHLLDTARTASGEATFADAPSGQAPVTDISDDFVNPRYHNFPGLDANGHSAYWLVNPGTADTKLTEYDNLSTTPLTRTYNFTSSQMSTLASYISNGNNFAFGLDSDCHYFNSGISFVLTTTPTTQVPEPASILLLGTGLLASLHVMRRKMRKS